MYKIFILLLVTLSAFGQDKEERIAWSEDTYLTWADFKGTPENENTYVATTNSGISISFSSKTIDGVKSIKFLITSYFYPQRSWYMEGAVNDVILKHEQTHFDISELFARKLRKKLSVLKADDPDLKQKTQSIYAQNEQERVNYQKLFDWETNHSTVPEEEAIWEKKVADALKAYDDWK